MDPLAPIPGEDPAFLDALDHVTRLASIERPCLVIGERGTGKELFTTRLHYLSRRWDAPLLKLNCAAFSDSLLDSELFGHEQGAFTGATRRHSGCFERADGGTLILDEIASASMAVQEKLLRVIEYGELSRLGGSETLQVDVRVIGAANVDLRERAAAGDFRADLLDRLAFDVVTIPPLRGRREDILPLAHGFAQDMVRALGGEVFTGFSDNAQAALLAHDWPGNVRELRNVVERAVYRADGSPGQVEHLVIDPFESPWSPGASPGTAGPSTTEQVATDQSTGEQGNRRDDDHDPLDADHAGFAERVAAFEHGLLETALAQNRHNQQRTANALGLGYHQLRRLLAKHDLRGPRRAEDGD